MVQQIINLLLDAHFRGAASWLGPAHTSFLEQIIGDPIQIYIDR